MKNFLSALLIALWLATPCPSSAQTADTPLTTPATEEHLLPEKIYFFVHSLCQNCRTAYVYLQNNHADLNIPFTNMKFKHNFDLYKECVNKFNISNQELTLPLICMGNEYLMGWNSSSPALFEQKLANFQKSQNN